MKAKQNKHEQQKKKRLNFKANLLCKCMFKLLYDNNLADKKNKYVVTTDVIWIH